MADSSIAPTFLVAMPQLRDPNFHRTVVLLIHHDEDGTFGVVLNRPTEVTALGLCSTLEIDWHGGPDREVSWGGPVQPQTGWILFGEEVGIETGDEIKPVGDGVSFAGSLDVLRKVASNPPQKIQLLLGYAGWGPGQLEYELSEGAWLLAPVRHDVVFGIDAKSMWDHVVRSLGIEPSTLVASRGVH